MLDILIRFPLIQKLEIFCENPQQNLPSWIPQVPQPLYSSAGVLLLLVFLSLPRKDLLCVYKWYFVWKSVLACNEIFEIDIMRQKGNSKFGRQYQAMTNFFINLFGLLLTNADSSKLIEMKLISYFLLSNIDFRVFKISIGLMQEFLFSAEIASLIIRSINWLVKNGENYSIVVIIKELWKNIRAKCDVKLIVKTFYYFWFFQLIFNTFFDLRNYHIPYFYHWLKLKKWIPEIQWDMLHFSQWNFPKDFTTIIDKPNKVFGLLALVCYLTNSMCKYLKRDLPQTQEDPLQFSAKTTAAIFFMAVDERLWSLPLYVREVEWWKIIPIYILIHISQLLLQIDETVIKIALAQPGFQTLQQMLRSQRVVGFLIKSSTYLPIICLCLYFLCFIPWSVYPNVAVMFLLCLNVTRVSLSILFQWAKYINNRDPAFNQSNKRDLRHENLNFVEIIAEFILMVFSIVNVLWMAISSSYWLFAINTIIDMGTKFKNLRLRWLCHRSWMKLGKMKLLETSETRADDDVCIICHEEIGGTYVLTRCQHLYHSQCLTAWLARSDTCPLCQRPIFKDYDLEQYLDLLVFLDKLT